jgi:hypothetical protein
MMPIPEQQSSLEAFARFSVHVAAAVPRHSSLAHQNQQHERAVLARKLRRVKRQLFLEAVGESTSSLSSRSSSNNNNNNNEEKEDDCSCDSNNNKSHGRCMVQYHSIKAA